MRKILSVFIILGLFVNPVYSQDLTAKNQKIVFNDFSKGLVYNPNPIGLPKSYGVICENLRLNEELRSLTKRAQLYLFGTMDATEPVTSLHRLYLKDGTKITIGTHGNEIETFDAAGTATAILDITTSDQRWSWVTWHNIAIGCDGYNNPVKYDGSSASATYLGTCLATATAGGAGPDTGVGAETYTYKVSFYTDGSAAGPYEILFNVASNPIVVRDKDVDLTMIPIGPDSYGGEAVTGRKVYRNTVAAQAVWNLLSNGTIADNTTVILTDSDADVAVGAAYPAGDATYKPPKGKHPLVHNNRVFFANDPNTASDTGPSTIYWGDDGNHDVFISTHYFNVRKNDGDGIEFILNLLSQLIVGKTTTIQKLYTDEGYDPLNDWSISDPFSFVGCAAPYSAVNTPLGIEYLARDGIYMFNGQHSILRSNIVSKVIDDISPSNFANVAGAYRDNKYYIAYASTESGGSTNDRVLIDNLVLNAFMIDIMNINCFASYDSGTDWGELFGGSSLSGEVYAFDETGHEIMHKKHVDFLGTWDDMRYIPDNPPVIGDPNSPVIELAWDCTIDGWDAEILGKDGAWDGTIDDVNTNLTDAIIDRPDTDGTYISQTLNTPGVSAYDKLYWNEILSTSATTDVTFSIRSDADDAAWGAWTNEYTNSAGSDISGETVNTYTQYRISMSTDDVDYTPYVIRIGSYNAKITWDTVGTSKEASIPIHWQSGWLDFGFPGYVKYLKKMYVIYESEGAGTLTLQLENYEGDTDDFDIDLSVYNNGYTEYFTTGYFLGEKIRLDITETSLNALKIREVIIIYDVAPII